MKPKSAPAESYEARLLYVEAMASISSVVGFFIAYGLASETSPPIHVLSVADVINPVSAEYITDSLKAAIEQGAQALIIQLDTPGGLDKSMRLIIKEMLNSPIPVIVYVAPSGSRAASAGTFMTLAAHVAAMAPGTNIGAAHPVAVGSGEWAKRWEKRSPMMRQLTSNRSPNNADATPNGPKKRCARASQPQRTKRCSTS